MSPGPRTALGVDFGTSHTIAVVRRADGSVRPLLFDGAPLMPSAVCADADGGLLVGRDAVHAGRRHPERFEPNPKRLIDRPSTLLGEREYAVPDLVAAVLDAVAEECRRVVGPPAQTTLTVPAEWGPSRRRTIEDAAARSGLGAVRLVPEPVAAAAYYAEALEHRMAVGDSIVVYDLGAGTFDASVVRRSANGFETVALDGRGDLGGLDIDAALVDHLGATYGAREGWRRLVAPATPVDRRHYREFQDEVRVAKERLSRHQQADIAIPLLDVEAHLTRTELEQIARPHLEQTVRVTEAVVRAAGLDVSACAGVFLVGGASRMPLVATMLHRALGVAPTVLDQPEVVVAEGSVLWTHTAPAPFPIPRTPPTAYAAPLTPGPAQRAAPYTEPAAPRQTPPAPLAAPAPITTRAAPTSPAAPTDRALPPRPPERTPPRPAEPSPPRTEADRLRAKRIGRRAVVGFILVDILVIAGLVWYFGPDRASGREDPEPSYPDWSRAALGEEVAAIPGAHDGAIASITAVATDAGPTLYSADASGTVRQWDPDADEPIAEYAIDTGVMSLWTVDWDGRETVVALDLDYRPHLLDLDTGAFLPPGGPDMLDGGAPERAAVGSVDGEPVLGLIGGGAFEFYAIADRTTSGVVALPGDLGYANPFFSDVVGPAVVGIDNALSIVVLDGAQGLPVAEAPAAVPEGEGVKGLGIAYDEGVPYAVVGVEPGPDVDTDPGERRFWDLDLLSPDPIGPVEGIGAGDNVYDEIVSADQGMALLVKDGAGGGYVVDVASEERSAFGGDSGPFTELEHLAFDGRAFAVTGDDAGDIRIWSLGL